MPLQFKLGAGIFETQYFSEHGAAVVVVGVVVVVVVVVVAVSTTAKNVNS